MAHSYVTDRWLGAKIAFLVMDIERRNGDERCDVRNNPADCSLHVKVAGYEFVVPRIDSWRDMDIAEVDSRLMSEVILPVVAPYGY